MPPSLQGEHIFNAVGDLTNDLASSLTRSINEKGSASNRIVAAESIHQLRRHAAALIRERNRGDFRTEPIGDVRNSMRYSQLAQATRTAVTDIISKNPSQHTQGYTQFKPASR